MAVTTPMAAAALVVVVVMVVVLIVPPSSLSPIGMVLAITALCHGDEAVSNVGVILPHVLDPVRD